MAEPAKLTYNGTLFKVKCEVSRECALENKAPPEDLLARAHKRLDKEVESGQIGFYLTYEKRLSEIWTALQAAENHSNHLVPQSISITIAAGAPLYPGIRCDKIQSDKSIGTLTIDLPAEQIIHWKYEWFKLNVIHQLKQLGIHDQVSNAQLFGAFHKVTIRGEAIKNYPLTALAQLAALQESKNVAIIANRQRRELAVILRNIGELRQKENMENMLAMVDQAMKQLNSPDVQYKLLRKDLSLALKSAIEGPEIFGIDMPLTLLVAMGDVTASNQNSPTQKQTDQIYPGAGKLNLICSQDRLEVAIADFDTNLYKDKTMEVSIDWIRKELLRSQYNRPLTQATLDELAPLIEKKESLANKVLIRGTPSVGGKEPYIRLRFKEADGRRPEANLELDSLDIRELQQRVLVKEGQLIAEIAYKSPSIIGQDVFGHPLPPAPNDDLIVIAAEGIVEKEPGRYYALSDGIPSVQDNTISLSKILIHEGDVNLRSGNIRFDGPIEIKGSIDSGAIVESTGNLTVFGEIRGAIVEARGDIIVTSGVTTGLSGSIYCGGNFNGDFVENSKLTVKGDISIKKALINSNVVCGGTIRVTNKDGVLAGGSVIVKENLYTANLAFPRGAITVLNVGVDWRIARALNIRGARLEKISTKLQSDRQNLRDLVQKTKNHTTPKQKSMKEDLQNKITRMRIICEKLEGLLASFQGKLTYNTSARIYIRENLTANLKLTIGGQIVTVLNDIKSVCILSKRRKGSFFVPLEEIEKEDQDTQQKIAG